MWELIRNDHLDEVKELIDYMFRESWFKLKQRVWVEDEDK